jgi:lipid-A-disaccharide synthase
MNQITIFWLAGESSGDLHSELIMKTLAQDGKRYRHIGIGGPKMQAMGLKPLFPFGRFAVMGFVEVIKHLGFFMKVQQRIRKLFEEDKPDLVILVDYPGLNLRIALLADEFRIPVLYYICPQFWAWKHERVFKIKDNVRHTACILPFEKEMLDIHNVTCTYVGHPIAEEVSYELDRESFARFFGIDPSKRWLGFFPGSRDGEIRKMLPEFLKASSKWPATEYELLLSKSKNVNHNLFMQQIEGIKLPNLKIVDGYNYEMMKYSEALVSTSGTVTLEAAFIGTPTVICYKANYLSYLIGRYLVKISRIGLPNIILNKDILPELVQNEMNADAINARLQDLLIGGARREIVILELQKLRGMLSDRKPSKEVPKIIEHLLVTYG